MAKSQSCDVVALSNHSALLNSGLGLFSIVGFPWLHHLPSLVGLTVVTKSYILLYGKLHKGCDVTLETRASSLL
jgi:hypothetical protein